jgi:cell division septation protein DedD
MKTSPLQQVKSRFGDKAKLVSSLKELTNTDLWLGKLNDAKGGLDSVSNAKLLRLHDTLSAVKKDFGSRAKLIDAVLGLLKRPKDAGYKSKLEGFTTPALLDLHRSASKRSKVEAKAPKAAAPAKKKKARSKKAKAKAKAAAASAPAAAPKAEKKTKKK